MFGVGGGGGGGGGGWKECSLLVDKPFMCWEL